MQNADNVSWGWEREEAKGQRFFCLNFSCLAIKYEFTSFISFIHIMNVYISTEKHWDGLVTKYDKIEKILQLGV